MCSRYKLGLCLKSVYRKVGLKWQQYNVDRLTRTLMYNVHTNLSGCRERAVVDTTLATSRLAHPYDKRKKGGGGYMLHVSAQRLDAPSTPSAPRTRVKRTLTLACYVLLRAALRIRHRSEFVPLYIYIKWERLLYSMFRQILVSASYIYKADFIHIYHTFEWCILTYLMRSYFVYFPYEILKY